MKPGGHAIRYIAKNYRVGMGAVMVRCPYHTPVLWLTSPIANRTIYNDC